MGNIIDIPELKFVKSTLSNLDSDKDREFCTKLINYIDSSSSTNDDEFFYDMMIAIRFIDEPGVIAYTKEDKRIYLSAPGKIGDKLLPWDFTYDHECLHQLWESFGVAEKIKKKGIKYDHELFNIASDVVINDYLRDIRGKTPPDGIYFPEDIEKQFGVVYDRRKDTQFTLYQKLLATGKSAPSNMANSTSSAQSDKGQGQSGQSGQSGQQGGQSGKSGQSGQSGQQGGQSGQQGGQGGQHKDIDKMSKEEAKASAQADAKRAQDAADKAKNQYGAGSQEAKDAQKAADEAKVAADKAKRAHSENGAKKAAKEAEAAANRAEKAANGGKEEGEGNPNGWSTAAYGGETGDLTGLEKEDISKITSDIDGILKKYKSRISGVFGNFVRQCKFSDEMRDSGLAAPVNKARSNWRQQTYRAIDAYIDNLVVQKKREWKASYARPKRGSGFVKFGEPIEMGRIPREDKLDIPIAFYLDKSGSMYSTIDKAAKTMYAIAQDIKKDWFNEKLINEMDFSFYAFDTQMHPLKLGQVPPASHDNMDLSDILDYAAAKEKKDLINIIITDGQYSINESQMASTFKKYEGLMVMVINNVNSEMKDLDKKFKNKFVYVQADSQFSL